MDNKKDELGELLKHDIMDGTSMRSVLGDPPHQNVLDKLARSIVEEEKITQEQFIFKSREYAIENDVLPSKRNNKGSNSLRVMKRGSISFYKFMEFISQLLGYKVIKFSVTLERPDKSTFEKSVMMGGDQW